MSKEQLWLLIFIVCCLVIGDLTIEATIAACTSVIIGVMERNK